MSAAFGLNAQLSIAYRASAAPDARTSLLPASSHHALPVLAGSVLFDGQPLVDSARLIGFVGQDDNLLATLTGALEASLNPSFHSQQTAAVILIAPALDGLHCWHVALRPLILFSPACAVRETVTFSARLRLHGGSANVEECRTAVDRLLKEAELMRARAPVLPPLPPSPLPQCSPPSAYLEPCSCLSF